VELLDEGINLTVFSAVASDDIVSHQLYQSRNLSRVTKQLNIPKSHRMRMLQFPCLFIRNFFRHPIWTLRAMSSAKYGRTAKNFKTLYFLDSMHNQNFDVVHCQFGLNGFIGAFLKDCKIAKKLVVTFHGSDITVFPQKEGFYVYDYMFSRCDAITAGTSFTQRLLIEHGCPPDKIHILPAGIRTEESKDIDAAVKDKNLLLSVGRLQEVKGFKYSIMAFALIADRFPDLVYLIAGNGSYFNQLQNLITAEKLEGRVILAGAKQDTEIIELYRKASIMLVPSIRASNGSEEGQGLVIQEAEMAGLPVIGTRTGGIPDGILDGITGFLVPEKDPAAIAEKISTLVTDQELRVKMGNAGKDFALKNYSMDYLTKKLIGCFI